MEWKPKNAAELNKKLTELSAMHNHVADALKTLQTIETQTWREYKP